MKTKLQFFVLGMIVALCIAIGAFGAITTAEIGTRYAHYTEKAYFLQASVAASGTTDATDIYGKGYHSIHVTIPGGTVTPQVGVYETNGNTVNYTSWNTITSTGTYTYQADADVMRFLWTGNTGSLYVTAYSRNKQ
jgi:hypothetical protein